MKKIHSIAIGSDHAGYKLKEQIKALLIGFNIDIKDIGPYSDDKAVNYAEYAHIVSNLIEKSNCDFGILICGSGNGMTMAANKHKGIRCSLCWNSEISKLARLHNDANICALPARFIDFETAKEIIENFLNTEFEGGRHLIRIGSIPIW